VRYKVNYQNKINKQIRFVYTLGAQDGRFSSTGSTASSDDFLEHRSVLKHVGQYEKPDLTAPDVDVLQLGGTSVSVRYVHRSELAVHVVLGFDQLPPVHLPGVGLASHDVTLRLVQYLDGYSDRHPLVVQPHALMRADVKLIRMTPD